MNRQRIIGALGFPAFLLAWTAGVVLATLQLQPASMWEPAPMWERSPDRDLPPVPTLNDPLAWSPTLADLAQHSDVVNGTWHPSPSAGAISRSRPAHPVGAISRSRQAPAISAHANASDSKQSRSAELSEPGHDVASSDRFKRVAGSRSGDRSHSGKPGSGHRSFGGAKSAARQALRDGRFSAAYATLRPRVAEARSDSEYLGLLALAAMRIGSHAEAVVLYQRLSALEPSSARWRMGLAVAQEHLGLDATSEYRQALALDDGDEDVRALLEARLASSPPASMS